MATKIEWTDRVWQPMHGCTKVSSACAHCYAEVMARRLQGNHIKSYEEGFKPTLNPAALDIPFRWKKPSMVFVCSMGDLFHKDVPFEYIVKVMDVINRNPLHTFQILTKRAERMATFFREVPVPANAWIGVTCESFNYYDRIDWLRSIDAPVRFISCEPLMGYLYDINLEGIHWVITGGESGNCARFIPSDCFRDLRDRCIEANVPFFFKQWGAFGEDGKKRSKEKNGCLLDGKEWKQMPLILNN